MTPEQFYRFALTAPYTAIKALPKFDEVTQVAVVSNLFTTLLWNAYGGRVPTKRDRRKAVRVLTHDLGRAYRDEIKALVSVLNEPYEAPTRAAAFRAYQLMIHISAAICTRADPDDDSFNTLIEGLVASTSLKQAT